MRREKKLFLSLSLACVSSLYPSSSSSLTPQPRRPAAASPQAPPTLRRRLRRLPRLLFRPRRPLLLSLLLGAGGLEPQNLSTSTSTSTSSLSFFFFIPVFLSPVLFITSFVYSGFQVLSRFVGAVVLLFSSKKGVKRIGKLFSKQKRKREGVFLGFSLSLSFLACSFFFFLSAFLSINLKRSR